MSAGLAIFALSCLAIPAHAQDAVCAQVKIEIKQKLSLERQAFDAVMRITNGLATDAIQNVGVNLTFQDQSGNTVIGTSDPNNTSASFFLRIDSLAGIGAIDGTGSVGPRTTGEIHWLILPAAGTGGTQPQGKMYFIGATLSYTLAGVPASVTVTPDFVTVKPQPLLALDYFLAGDVYADDAFTPEIEPSIPFTLGVRIKNVGGGTAAKTAIESAQPKIVDNQQGLLIGFQILSSFVNDQPAQQTLLLNFGDIGPGVSKVGRWSMITTLSGKFTDLQAGYTHADSLGGALTSLIQGINTHLLVHDVKVDLPGRDNVRDFLALDGSVLRVYESEGTDSAVVDQSPAANLTLVSAGKYNLNFPATTGLVYAKLADPFAGQKSPGQVLRSDGKVLPPENFWLSKTRNANLTWSYFINIFDVNSTGNYTVNFTSGGAASLAGFVYIDSNNNGSKDAAEVGVGAVAVTLSGTDNVGAGVTTTGYTNPDGSFNFVQLQPGTYSLKVAPVAGYVDGTLTAGTLAGNAAGDTIAAISAGAGATGTGYLFAKRISTTGPPSQADLAIAMSASATTVASGSNVVFTIVASNAGPDLATSVRAVDLLPAGLAFVSATGSPGAYDSATGLWSIGDLAKNATATLTLTARVTSVAAPIVNTVNVSSVVADANLANNSASATINPDAGSIAVTQAVVPAARILVLASCASTTGPEDPACVSSHAGFVAPYLVSLGFDAKAVTDTESFRSAMRSGRYNVLWISGGAAKLTGTLAQEVREAAFRGESLVVDGPRDAGNAVLDEATGVTSSGPSLGNNLPILLAATPGNIATVGAAAALSLHNGQALATFPSSGGAPAIVSNNYGQGKAVVAAFDLVGTLQQAASEQALHGFIAQLLAGLVSTPPDPVVGDSYVPLTTTIRNQSTAVDVDVVTTLPPGATVVDSVPPPTSSTATQASWHFTLGAGQTTAIALGLRMPAASGQFTVQSSVTKGQGANTTPVGNFSYPIAVATSDQFGPALIANLSALSIVNTSDRAARDAAIAALQSVAGLFGSGQFENAIAQLVAAGNSLETVTSVNMAAYETTVDQWLLEAEQRWYLAPTATTYQVTGIVTLSGAGLAGVSFAATGGVTCTSSDAAGSYGCVVPAGWSGSVTPARAGNTFAPPSRSYTTVQLDQPAQNYVASASGQAPAFTSGAAPGGAVSSAYTFTLTASGSPAPAFSVSGGALPPGITLDTASGVLAGTPTTAGSFSGSFAARNGVSPDAQQNFAIVIAVGAQTITFGALSDRVLGAPAFTLSATASSGLAVIFASITSSVCTVSGTTVTMLAIGTCTIRASQPGNANFAAAASVDQSFHVVAATSPPAITSGPAPGGTVGLAYSFGLTASGAPAPTFGVAGGALPPGLTLNATSGLISGVPTTAGSFSGVFAATNGVPPDAQQNFLIAIALGAQTITFAPLSDRVLGTPAFTLSATASSGLPVSFASLTSAVCTVAGASATLVSAGTCTIRASQAGDANYAAAGNVDRSFNVTAATSAPTITSGAAPGGTVGTAYSFTVTATGFPAPTFAVSSGALPPGLTLNATSGLISGTPITAGTFNGAITASNGVLPNATQSFAIVISSTPPPPTIVNGSFETPVMPTGSGGYQYFTGLVAGWNFAGTGVQRHGSAWGAADSGDGNQTAFIQNTGSLSQTLTLAPGAYALSFLAAQRSYSIPAGGVQPLRVSVDGVAIGSLVTPPDASFRVFTIPFTIGGAGSHTISFDGTDASGDKSTFVDAVTLATVSGAPSITSGTLPNGNLNFAYSFTVTATGFPVPTFGVSSGALPTGLILNPGSGLVSGTPITAGTFNGVITASNGVLPNATQSFAIVISSTAPPPVIVNGSFETPVMPTGSGGYQYFTGVVAGWNFAGTGVQRHGSAWGAADSGDGNQTAFIQNTGSLSQTLTLAPGAYALSFLAAQRSYSSPAGGVQPLRLSVDGVAIGSLVTPTDTSFRVFTIPFTVASGGPHTISFAGTDGSGDKSTFVDAVTLATTSGAPSITSGTLPNGNLNFAYSFTVTATGFPAPTFGVSSGALPTGLTLNATSGLISGTPLTAGTFNGVITASNGVLPSATQSFAIVISSTAPPPVIVNGSFETPVMPAGPNGYQYFTGLTAGWNFAGSGVQRHGSAWGAADSGDGNQTAFIQNTGSLSQTLTLAPGAYALSFLAAQRSYSVPAGGVQPLRVSVDGVAIGSLVTPPDTSFRVFTIPFTIGGAGSHTISFAGTDASGDKSTFVDSVTLADASSPATATFKRTDVATQGNWKGVYGADGYAVFEDSAAYPAFARVAPADKLDYIWDPSPTASRAYQRTLSGRIAACWYSPGSGGGSFSIDVNLVDGAAHSVAMAMLDWDALNRSTRIDVFDVITSQLLDSRTLSSYQQGAYLVWNVRGHVRFRFTSIAGPNAVVSGIFFGAPLP